MNSLLRKRSQRLTIELICESPSNSRGLPFNQLKVEDFHCIPPQIIQEPHDVSPSSGETVELICVINGDPAPQITWIRNTDLITPTPRVRVLPNGSLRIEQVRSEDNGIYECMGRNEVGESRARPVRIIVNTNIETPRTTRESQTTESYRRDTLRFVNNPPSELQVGTNDEIVLHCTTNNLAEIQWYFNGRQLSHSTQMTKVHTNGTLIVSRASLRNAGTYRCEAFNDYGRINADVNVRINELPEFIITLESQTVTVGTTLYLECDADGDPIPTLSWKINGKEITGTSSTTGGPVVVTNRISLHNENTELEIENVTVADSGQYTCVAKNSKGRREVTAEITVENPQGPPRLQFEPYNMDAFTGTTIELPCKAEGDAPPQVKWRKDGRLIPADSTVKYKISSSGSLYVQNITTADAGRYECSIFNEFGRTTASGFVTVKSNEVLAPGDRYVKIAFAEASKEIDLAINNTIDTLFSKKENPKNQTRPNYGDLLRVFRFPTGEARQLARAAEIYERTLVNIRKHVRKGENLTMEATDFEYKELLSPEHLHLVAELSGCQTHRLIPNCTDMCFHAKYRTIDGTCNNLNNPTWGASLTAFRRIEKPVYENGFSMPVGWSKGKLYNGYEKPLARLISTKLISTKEITSDNKITHMTMQWGQFLDHDLDHAIPSVSSETWDGIDCKKTCEYAAPCFPMDVPQNDPRVLNRRCIDFVRSSSICGSGMTSVFFDSVQQREQINQLTSYIDASQVYGYSKEFANDLRNLTTEEGLLRAGVSFPGQKPSLPFAAPQDGIDCRRNLDESKMNCFVAGDIRVNEQVGLLAMHTIWMREHNRIASQLKKMNKHWSGDTIYNEARKIVGAQMQHVTYKQWLPIILGSKGMEMLGEYKGYNPNLNPSIANEFATAALRFGHSLINPILHRLNETYLPIPQGNLQLHKAFFAPWRLAYEGGVDPLMRGLFTVPAKLKTPEQNLNSDLTEKLFQTAHAVALDLAAMNIQRGRDHGIPSYNEYRKFCNLTEAKTFDDLKVEIISEDVRSKLEDIYGHPDNIDIWVGGILEEQVEGGKVGPLFRCLLIEQFTRLRDGDRFYYENPSVFMPEQLQQIKQSNLGRVLCDNGDNITEVTENVFMLPSTQGGYKQCEDIQGINLYFWQECQTCNNLSPLLSSYVPQTYTKRSKRSVGSTYADDADADENVIAEEEMKEERISGLEEVISSFQKELKKLKKKIHRLEETCQMSASSSDDDSEERVQQQQQQQSAPIKGHHHCHDSNGMKRLNNEVWDQDACTKCECKHSEVTCIREKCPELTCPNGITPIHNTNDCCPHCPLLLGTKLNITVDSV
ncbi:PXDN family protein [Megaselia abdita]